MTIIGISTNSQSWTIQNALFPISEPRLRGISYSATILQWRDRWRRLRYEKSIITRSRQKIHDSIKQRICSYGRIRILASTSFIFYSKYQSIYYICDGGIYTYYHRRQFKNVRYCHSSWSLLCEISERSVSKLGHTNSS